MKTISTDRTALHEALWKSVLLGRAEKVNRHLPHFCSIPPVLFHLVFSAVISKLPQFPTRRQSEQHCLEVQTWREANDFVLQEFPDFIHRTWASISFGATETSPGPQTDRGLWRRKQMQKGSVCRQVLQLRETSEKKNSKIWSWDCYWVEYFPLFWRRQPLIFSVKKLIEYWAVNNVQFYLHPLFGLFWSFR